MGPLLSLLLASSISFAGTKSFLKYAEDLPQDQQKLLEGDLQLFSALPLTVRDPHFNRALDIQGTVTKQGLLLWISQRVRYIVGEDFDFSSRYYIETINYKYENPGLLPDSSRDANAIEMNESEEENRVVTRMTNIGAAIYIVGKTEGVLLGLDLPGIGKVPVSSPRIGILQVGEGLFQLRGANNLVRVTSLDTRLRRLGILFHEARHSDGRGKTIGMTHANCPPNHAYAGFSACDFSLNGAYSVGGQVIKAFAENCKDCRVSEKEVLRLNYLDSFSRVIPEMTEADPNREDFLFPESFRNACESLKTYRKKTPLPEVCERYERLAAQAEAKASRIIKATYLDSKPEGKVE